MTESEMMDLGDKVADSLVKKLSDPETIEQVGKAWGNTFDVNIGKGVRKLIFYIVGFLVISASLKFNLIPEFLRRMF